MLHELALKAPQIGISDHLDGLRQDHPEIDSAVFLDFRAGTVLCISSFAGQPQEKLDGIVEMAARVFDGRLGARRQFTLATPIEVLVVQMVEPGTALAVIFEPDIEIDRARGLVREATCRLLR